MVQPYPTYINPHTPIKKREREKERIHTSRNTTIFNPGKRKTKKKKPSGNRTKQEAASYKGDIVINHFSVRDAFEMLGNERRGGEESPLFLLRQWKKKERAILYAFQTPSTVSFRSSRDSSSAFSFHKLVRLDSDPMESSIHRGTISISPGSSQRSAFRFPPPSSSPHRWGEGGGLGSFKRSIEPLAPTVCSSRAFLLAFRFSESIHGY